ncbi:DUF3857 domain-containing transglutaminase family protein [bacterium]|nr:DUF3857 domain-containing transglutaminase family protein [candidate division CSSED10-310 bacterium]
MTDGTEKDFITSDGEKRRLIDSAGTDKDHKGADAVAVYDHSWGTVEPSGLGNLHNNRLVKILTEKGIAKSSVLRFDYDPRSFINNVLRLRIHRKGGNIEELDTSDYRDVMQPEAMLYWRVKMRLFSLPALEVGDAVEWETYKKGFNVAYLESASGSKEKTGDFDPDTWVDPETGIKPPMYGAFYDIVMFRETIPVKEKRYTLLSPRSMPLSFEIYHGELRTTCTMDDKITIYSWEKKDIEGYKPELRMPAPKTSLPKLLVSTIPNWKEKSRWFYRMNLNQFEWNEDIKRKVEEVTAGCETDDEKAAALLHWVAQEIRYIGFSICQGEGYTIHPGTMTFRERGGVCKEYAGMLVTMLRAAGLESYAAQTLAIEPASFRITADEFDHCVTAWRKPDGTFVMLDPTWAPYSMQIWDAAETGQCYLIGTPEGEDMQTVREFTPEDSKLTIRAASRLHPRGGLDGRLTYWGKGRSDSTQRFMKAWASAASLDHSYQKLFSVIDPAVRIQSIKTSDVGDLKKSYENKVQFKISNYAVHNRNEMYFRLPSLRFMRAPQIARYLTIAELPERKFDLLVIFLQLVETHEEISLPEGYRLASEPIDICLENTSVLFKAKLMEENGSLNLNTTFAVKERIIAKEKYKEYKEITDKVNQLADRWITLCKTP